MASGSKAHTWDSVEAHYVDLCKRGWSQHLVMLVKHIVSSGVSKRTYALTSHDKLIISIYEKIEFDREALHITFNKNSQTWLFEYYPAPFIKPEFVRHYPADKGIIKFDQFVKMINW